jgi:uncharacterized protein (DUF2345 family)
LACGAGFWQPASRVRSATQQPSAAQQPSEATARGRRHATGTPWLALGSPAAILLLQPGMRGVCHGAARRGNAR